MTGIEQYCITEKTQQLLDHVEKMQKGGQSKAKLVVHLMDAAYHHDERIAELQAGVVRHLRSKSAIQARIINILIKGEN